jgi:hypothetical protein
MAMFDTFQEQEGKNEQEVFSDGVGLFDNIFYRSLCGSPL